MMRIALFTVFVSILILWPFFFRAATYKLMIEVKEEIDKVLVKDELSSEIKQISPWKTQPNIFLFECNNLAENQLVATKKSTYRILRIDNQSLTTWFPLEKNSTISFTECFSKFADNNQIDKKKGTYDFIINNYLGNPIIHNNQDFRQDQQNFSVFNSEGAVFICIDSIKIDLSVAKKSYELSIIDPVNFEIVWMDKSFNSPVLTYQMFSSGLKKELQYNKTYMCKASVNAITGNDPDIYLYSFKVYLTMDEFETLNKFLSQ